MAKGLAARPLAGRMCVQFSLTGCQCSGWSTHLMGWECSGWEARHVVFLINGSCWLALQPAQPSFAPAALCELYHQCFSPHTRMLPEAAGHRTEGMACDGHASAACTD